MFSFVLTGEKFQKLHPFLKKGVQAYYCWIIKYKSVSKIYFSGQNFESFRLSLVRQQNVSHINNRDLSYNSALLVILGYH